MFDFIAEILLSLFYEEIESVFIRRDEKEEEKLRTTGKYIIAYSRFYKVTSFIGFLILFCLLIIFIRSDSNIFLIVLFVIFFLLETCHMLYTFLARVRVDGEIVEYRNFIGIKKKYNINNLWVYNKPGNMQVYDANNKKVFTIGISMKNQNIFFMSVRRKLLKYDT